jgi:hypothetical protein
MDFLRRSLRILSPTPVILLPIVKLMLLNDGQTRTKHSSRSLPDRDGSNVRAYGDEVEQSHATAGISSPHIRLIASQEAANGANSNSRKDR